MFFLVVDLPNEPDGKQIDIHFVKEGNIDNTTRTSVKPEVSLLSFVDSFFSCAKDPIQILKWLQVQLRILTTSKVYSMYVIFHETLRRSFRLHYQVPQLLVQNSKHKTAV